MLVQLDRAVEIYSGLIAEGVLPSKEVYTSLVHACSKSGDLAKALAIYADMKAAGMEADEVRFFLASNSLAPAVLWCEAECAQG
jgi:pentatricopeptide repeat protein